MSTVYSTSKDFADQVLAAADPDQHVLIKAFIDKYNAAVTRAVALNVSPVTIRQTAVEMWHKSDDPQAAKDAEKRAAIAEQRAKMDALEKELDSKAKAAIDAIVEDLKKSGKSDDVTESKRELNKTAKALIGAIEALEIPGDFEIASNVTEIATQESASKTAGVREWLRANGHDVSDRGRIADDLQALYDEAHAA